MKDVVVGDTGATLWLFLAGTVLVLLIASANAANLLLARGAARTRELAVRASLGARRERLVRQLLAESAVLGGCSAVAGLAGAWALTRLLIAQAGPLIPRAGEVRIDLATAAVATTVAVGAAILAGVAPALWLTGRRLGESTRTGGRTATGGRTEGRARRAMVVAEVALAVWVLVGTALLVKTMARLHSQPPGFEAAGVLSFRLVAPPDPYRDHGKLAAYLESVDANLRRLPGVSHVAIAASLPPDRGQESNNYTVDGDEPGRAGRGTQGSGVATWNVVSPEFFDALAIPAIEGRTFNTGDGATAPAVAVVSRLFAQKHFPGGDAIGRRFKGGDWSATAPWTTIIGVVGDVPYERGVWGGPSPTVYVPYAQNAGSRWQFVVVRTASEAATAPRLARAVHAADPRVPLRDTATMSERLVSSTAVPRFRMRLFGALAAVALVLAVIGIHGILACQVGQRRRETAIRQALGARRPAILAGVVRSGLGLTAAGIVLGLAGAFVLARSLATFLFGVTPDDVSAYASAAAVLLGAATLATLLPALKAVLADPLSVLRED
jgi:predicted permease